MSYFVIKESIKGKLSDRAILLEPLPKGTVKLEVSIAVKVRGHVISVPHGPPNKEEPGRVKLCIPLTSATTTTTTTTTPSASSNSDTIKYVELWQRCLSDGVQCRVGDELEIDVIHYRPENLFFARNVKTKKYFALFREYGRIKRIVKEGGFAFVRSMNRSNDLYFRLSDVTAAADTDTAGAASATSGLEIGSLVTFDVEPDDSFNRGGGGSNTSDPSRLKAIRVQLLSNLLQEQLQATSQNISDFHIFRKLSIYKIKEEVSGTIIRSSERNERTDVYKSLGHIEYDTQAAVTSVSELYPVEFRSSIELFLNTLSPEVKEVSSSCVPQSRITFFRKICDDLYPSLDFELDMTRGMGSSSGDTASSGDTNGATSEGQALKMRRLTEQECTAKRNQKLEGIQIKETSVHTATTAPHHTTVLPIRSRTIFTIADVQDSVIHICQSLPLTGLAIVFDLYYDFLENKSVARNIQVEIQKLLHNPLTTSTSTAGVIESYRRLNTHSNIALIRRLVTRDVYISVVPSSSSSSGNKDKIVVTLAPAPSSTMTTTAAAGTWEVGSVVNFERSLWGGRVAYASNLSLNNTMTSSPMVASSTCSSNLLIGVMVAEDKVVLIDKSGSSSPSSNTNSTSAPGSRDNINVVTKSYWNVSGLRQKCSNVSVESALSRGLKKGKSGGKSKDDGKTNDEAYSLERYLSALFAAQMQDSEQLLVSQITATTNTLAIDKDKDINKVGMSLQDTLHMMESVCVFPPNIREPVLLCKEPSTTPVTASSPGEFSPAAPSVGDLVYCTAVYDSSGIASAPLVRFVGNPVKLPLPTIKRVKGLISRVDVEIPSEVLRHMAGTSNSLSSVYHTTRALAAMTGWLHSTGHTADSNSRRSKYVSQLCEIRLVDSSLSVSSVAVALATASQSSADTIYYCDISEISVAAAAVSGKTGQIQSTPDNNSNGNGNVSGGNNNDSKMVVPKVGDMVEFFPVDISESFIAPAGVQGLAVGVHILPPPSAAGNVSEGVSTYIFITIILFYYSCFSIAAATTTA